MAQKSGYRYLLVLVVAVLVFPALSASAKGKYTFTRLSNPDRTVVSDSKGSWLATLTDDAYTVTLRGPEPPFWSPLRGRSDPRGCPSSPVLQRRGHAVCVGAGSRLWTNAKMAACASARREENWTAIPGGYGCW
jgi:hypothetical protein